MPKGVAKTVYRIQAAFLERGGSRFKEELHMVKWADIAKSKSQVGLGIRNVLEANDCLLAKWWWRCGPEDNYHGLFTF